MLTLHDQTLTSIQFKKVQKLILDLAGIALSDFKQVMVQSRLNKRLRVLQLETYGEYLEYLELHKEEEKHFVNALTTNKTDFFRESHHFDYLSKIFFPELVAKAERTGHRKLRIWCSASSTGEEPYTLAMCVREFFGADPTWDIKILASDIDTDVLATADRGVYNAERVAELDPLLLRKYFTKESRDPNPDYRVRSELRDLITYRQLNLQSSYWPINTKFDAIFCRNVMIYFNAESQTKIVEHFGQYLNDDGRLFIGHSESLFGLTGMFKPLGDTIYGFTATNTSRKENSTSSSSDVQSVLACDADLAQEPIRTPAKARSVVENRNPPVVSDVDTIPKHPIIIGEVLVSEEPIWITTLLGSCVGVCLYDDVARVGGMNHFMLPRSFVPGCNSSNYGVHSMELLINSIMSHGGDRRRLKAKVFGGGNVLRTSTSAAGDIGRKNVEFAMKFLEIENIPVVASHTLQDVGMHVQFNTHTAKVVVRMLDPNATAVIEEKDKQRAATVESQMQPRDFTLFYEV